MNDSDQISSYLALLKTRQAGQKRTAQITGAFFVLSILTLLGFGLVNGLGGREIYLLAGLNIVLGISFLMAWVRLEVISQTIELLTSINNFNPSRIFPA